MSLIFRNGTWDEDIFNSVCKNNEYQVKDFTDLTVLDIGSHVGSFSFLALKGGAKRVIAVEPDKENFLLLRHNLHYEALNGTAAICISAAVGGHNGTTMSIPTNGGNTGGNAVGQGDTPVSVITLDCLIAMCDDSVTLLKLDCEGGEFPALRQCTKLDCIKNIVGEYHLGAGTLTDLETMLTDAGFNKRFVATSESLGLFWAWRNKHCFNF